MTLTDTQQDPGSVDYLVIEFPPDQQEFTGEMAEQLQQLAQSGTIRILRVLVAVKDGEELVLHEFDTSAPEGARLAMAGDVATLLADDALASATSSMAPGTVAGVVVWENTWVAGFAAAARRAGGRIAATGRISAETLATPEEG